MAIFMAVISPMCSTATSCLLLPPGSGPGTPHRRGEEETQLQDGLKHGHPAAPQHQVLHGGALLQHDPAARRDAENDAEN